MGESPRSRWRDTAGGSKEKEQETKVSSTNESGPHEFPSQASKANSEKGKDTAINIICRKYELWSGLVVGGIHRTRDITLTHTCLRVLENV